MRMAGSAKGYKVMGFVAGVAALALLVAGCGGGGLSEEEVQSRVDAGITSALASVHESLRAQRIEVVDLEGSTLRLKISGSTRVVADGPWLMGDIHWKPRQHHAHGVSTRLLGHATYDLERDVFTEFELVAVGRRWGATANNGRGNDVGPAPIGFVFSIAPPSDVHRVAPTFVDMYGVDWVIDP